MAEIPSEKSVENKRAFKFTKDTPESSEGKKMHVLEYKTWDKITGEIPELKSKFSRSTEVMEAFNKFRTPLQTSPDKTTERKPHFLICGGFVRDLLLDKTPKDLDFATNLTADQVKAALSEHFAEDIESGNLWFDDTGSRFSVVRMRFRDTAEEYEIASFREDVGSSDGRRPDDVVLAQNAGIDASRRDFTVNALFYNPIKGRIIDYVGGLEDLKAKNLRFVGNPEDRLQEDRIRALRYIRFLLKTSFEVDEQSKTEIQKVAAEVATLPAESIMAELTATINSMGEYSFGEILKKYEEFGLLEHILPEVSALKDCEQGPPYHMEGNAFEHTTMVASNLPKDSSTRLVLAAMLHDIAKLQTRNETILPDGSKKVSFIGHAEEGSPIAAQRMRKLRSTTQGIEPKDIEFLVKNHIRAFSFPEMGLGKARELVRHPLSQELFDLAEADIKGSFPVDEKIAQENILLIQQMRDRYVQLKNEELKLKEQRMLINGNDIISHYEKRFGQKPQGILIGKLKRALLDWIDLQESEAKITIEQLYKQLDIIIDNQAE